MLVIVSDLHLTDGSSAETVHQGTLRVFRERLRSLAYAASWRAGGAYRPIERLDVLLLGDVIDVLRSSRWLAGADGANETVRPWSDPSGGALAAKVHEITAAAIYHNRTFFSLLRELQTTGIASVPSRGSDERRVKHTWLGSPCVQFQGRTHRILRDVCATPDDLIADTAEYAASAPPARREPVEVRIHYFVGNHDWYFHLPGTRFTRTRGRLVRAMGLDNDPAQPFPHSAEEPQAGHVRALLERHHVCARHGDIYDPFNYSGARDASSLGDAIVIELLSRFVLAARRQFHHTLPPARLAAFNEIDNIRPLWLAPVWVAEMTRRACQDPRQLHQVQALWNDVVSDFLRLPFVRDQLRCGRSRLRAQKLRLVLRLSTQALRHNSGRVLEWLAKSQRSIKPSYARFAAREPALTTGAARYVVYGHTHRHELVPLDAQSRGRWYVNSGTWRPVRELARYSPRAATFARFNTMTYLAFFQDDERSGRGFEAWSGSLGPAEPSPHALPDPLLELQHGGSGRRCEPSD